MYIVRNKKVDVCDHNDNAITRQTLMLLIVVVAQLDALCLTQPRTELHLKLMAPPLN